MKITLKLYGNLKKFSPNKKEQAALDVEEGITIQTLLARFGVSDSDVWLCAINTTLIDESASLHDGDVLEVFEPVGGGN